jgi:signal peptidase II
MADPNRGRFFGFHVLASVLVLSLDQWTKALVSRHLELHESVAVIPGFFSISHVLNRGAAFSLFADAPPHLARWGLVVFSVLVIAAVLLVLWRAAAEVSKVSIALALILGGATGNLIDRIRLGSVIDFLAFDFGSYHWPDFNIADSAIVIGSCLLVLDVLVAPKKAPASSVDAR